MAEGLDESHGVAVTPGSTAGPTAAPVPSPGRPPRRRRGCRPRWCRAGAAINGELLLGGLDAAVRV
ncbi:hypothetical protein ACH41H_39235 [Streptomyces sp. NPDC020800]|uniref:hypothetical protein n=1 Tax=Streptomyces sp. NPDC020800 TaxID=3365092 RepID=UPI0037A8CE4D